MPREAISNKPVHHSNSHDLNEHRLVGYVEDLIFSSELEYNKQIFSNWKSAIEISGVIGQFEAVRGGAGIGVLHDFMAGNDNSLIPVLPDESTLSRSYWMVWHESLKNSRRVQARRGIPDTGRKGISKSVLSQEADHRIGLSVVGVAAENITFILPIQVSATARMTCLRR